MLKTYGSNRPKWNVAGVDYYVGVPSGAALADPSTNAPAGCTFSSGSSQLACSGSNIVVKGFDFSLNGGMKLYITGSNNVVSGNKFALAPNCSDPLVYFSIDAGATLTISQNSFDGGGAACINNSKFTFGAMIFSNRYKDSSTLVLEYNYVYNTPQHVIENYGAPTKAARLVMRYNVFNEVGYTGHPDGLQLNGGKFDSSLIAFNTIYHTLNMPGAITSQPLHVESQLTSDVSNTEVSYNTVLAPGTCNGGVNYPAGCSANVVIACKNDSGANTNTGFKAYGNRVDWSGAIVALQNNGCTGTTWGSPAANIDLKTGSPLSP
jgi:hypothetical protein